MTGPDDFPMFGLDAFIVMLLGGHTSLNRGLRHTTQHYFIRLLKVSSLFGIEKDIEERVKCESERAREMTNTFQVSATSLENKLSKQLPTDEVSTSTGAATTTTGFLAGVGLTFSTFSTGLLTERVPKAPRRLERVVMELTVAERLKDAVELRVDGRVMIDDFTTLCFLTGEEALFKGGIAVAPLKPKRLLVVVLLEEFQEFSLLLIL